MAGTTVQEQSDDDEARLTNEQRNLTDQALRKLSMLAINRVDDLELNTQTNEDTEKPFIDSPSPTKLKSEFSDMTHSQEKSENDNDEEHTLNSIGNKETSSVNSNDRKHSETTTTSSYKQNPSFVSLSHQFYNNNLKSDEDSNSENNTHNNPRNSNESNLSLYKNKDHNYIHYEENSENQNTNHSSQESKLRGSDNSANTMSYKVDPQLNNINDQPQNPSMNHHHSHHRSKKLVDTIVDPRDVNIFSNQEVLDDKLRQRYSSLNSPNGSNVTLSSNRDNLENAIPDDLPEGISRPLYVPAVIRKTEEKIDLNDYYNNMKEKQRRLHQQQLIRQQQLQAQQQQQVPSPGQGIFVKLKKRSSGSNSQASSISSSSPSNNIKPVDSSSDVNKPLSPNGSLMSYFFQNNTNPSSPTDIPINQINNNGSENPAAHTLSAITPKKSDSSSSTTHLGIHERPPNFNTTSESIRTVSSNSINKIFLKTNSVTPNNKQKVNLKHWKPDHSASSCMGCGRDFSLLIRKHHCRKCGNIFCDSCLRFTVRLNYDLEFKLFAPDDSLVDPIETGWDVKACEHCHKKYKSFLQEKLTELAKEDDEFNKVNKLNPQTLSDQVTSAIGPIRSKDDDEGDDFNDDDGYEWSTF